MDVDEPITDVVVVTSTSDCPHGYTIRKATPSGHPANLWEKVIGGRSAERYICFTKTTGQNDTIVEDMIIPPPSQRYLRKGYRAISQTPDGDEPLRHKQLVLKRSKRTECTEAIVDIEVYRSKDDPARNFRKLAKVNDLYVCVRPAKISPTPSNTATETAPVANTGHVEENVQVNLDSVVESSPNMDAMLDKMDQALKISTITTAANTYPQTVATQSMPEATSTYSSSQTTPGSYSMPESSNYAGNVTQGATYPASTYSSSQTTTSSYSMPESNTYSSSNTQGATTYPASTYSGSSYSNSGAPYSSSQTGYSNPSDPYSGASYPSSSNTQYPSANNQYSNTAYSTPGVCQSSTSYSSSSYTNSSGQYSSNPYSNSSYPSTTNPYANAGYSNAGYSSAGYSGASYGSGSSLPYSANPTAAGAYSTQQYPPPAGYSTQPPPSTYPTGYQSGGYPSAPPTNQGYGGYAPTGGSYGSNQPGYPPTTQHFSGDIGFGF